MATNEPPITKLNGDGPIMEGTEWNGFYTPDVPAHFDMTDHENEFEQELAREDPRRANRRFIARQKERLEN